MTRDPWILDDKRPLNLRCHLYSVYLNILQINITLNSRVPSRNKWKEIVCTKDNTNFSELRTCYMSEHWVYKTLRVVEILRFLSKGRIIKVYWLKSVWNIFICILQRIFFKKNRGDDSSVFPLNTEPLSLNNILYYYKLKLRYLVLQPYLNWPKKIFVRFQL